MRYLAICKHNIYMVLLLQSLIISTFIFLKLAKSSKFIFVTILLISIADVESLAILVWLFYEISCLILPY